MIWWHGMRFQWKSKRKSSVAVKFNDVELSDEEKPKNAHNAVTNIGDDLKNSPC